MQRGNHRENLQSNHAGQRDFVAAIFDMDGVVTQTAAVHSRAWKRMFDEFLRSREATHRVPFREFTHDADYLVHVDGRPRSKGVESFLQSRGIVLPPGSPRDPAGCETVCGLGNRKNALFNEMIEREGAGVYDSTVAFIQKLRASGIRVGLATSSRNSATILGKTHTASLFATVVDGVVSAQLGLKGKPAPDIFVVAAANLGVPAGRAIVVEDAVTGVQAGARGGFALVVGIARENNAGELRDHGADVVVRDLAETSLEKINRLIRHKRASACSHSASG
ncbi:MAG: Haloacid dehalogenase superfamily, subfamily variant 3 with third motif having or [Verrucomicrobia bacterium]|nr:Haloacid dehalogenase superfamily, subfamily variant 3 with third motif having or [Verrucomicrobiota bacterium]